MRSSAVLGRVHDALKKIILRDGAASTAYDGRTLASADSTILLKLAWKRIPFDEFGRHPSPAPDDYCPGRGESEAGR
jgi:hypothetical protein